MRAWFSPHDVGLVRAERSDGSALSWRFPRYGGSLPHDLVHLLAEAGAGLGDGVWGCIDSGADPGVDPKLSAWAGAGLRAAEALATVRWFDTGASDVVMLEEIRARCDALRAPRPRLTLERVALIRACLTLVRQRFRALARQPGASLELRVRWDAPEETLLALVEPERAGRAATRRGCH